MKMKYYKVLGVVVGAKIPIMVAAFRAFRFQAE
jgi:hypothetical protein